MKINVPPPEQMEWICLGGNVVLGAVVGILGGLGMKMHDRLIAAYTPAQKTEDLSTQTTAKQYYRCFLAFMVIGVCLAVGFVGVAKITKVINSPDSVIVGSSILSAVLVVFTLIQGALGVQIYNNLTKKYTDAQKDAIPASTKYIHDAFIVLMALGIMFLIIIAGLAGIRR